MVKNGGRQSIKLKISLFVFFCFQFFTAVSGFSQSSNLKSLTKNNIDDSAGNSKNAGAVVISPSFGTWSNKQSLILDVPSGCEAYYSFSGLDPLESGMAYDGPVIIDMTGEINLRVVSIYPGDIRLYQSIVFSVIEDVSVTMNGGKDINSLLSIIKHSENLPYITYAGGTVLQIPSTMRYSMTDGIEPYISGRALFVESQNGLTQYVPLIIDSGFGIFRFMVNVRGVAGMSEPPVPIAPIACNNWEYISFTGSDRIMYSVDSSSWLEFKKPFYVDRLVQHTISWQIIPAEIEVSSELPYVEPVIVDTSLRGKIKKYSTYKTATDKENSIEDDALFEQQLSDNANTLSNINKDEKNALSDSVSSGNQLQAAGQKKDYYTVNTFILPTKPTLKGIPSESVTNSAVTLSPSISGYMFCCTENGFSSEYTQSLVIDCFYGSSYNADLKFNVYYGGIYQGQLSASFVIDKIPPQSPKFIVSTTTRYSRNSILLQVSAEGTVYYSIEKTVESYNGFTDNQLENIVLNENKSSNPVFMPLAGRSILLPEKQKTAVFYTVYVYSSDNAGNESERAGYHAVIDPANYYLNSNAGNSETADGSPSRPYNSFNSYISAAMNTSPFTRLYVSGNFEQNSSIVIKGNCEVIGIGKARLFFSEGTGVYLNGANLSVKDCDIETVWSGGVIQKSPESLYRRTLMTCADSVLSLNNCEIAAVFGASGSIFTLERSSLNLKNCGLTLKSDTYATIVSSEDSEIIADSLRCSSVGETALIFSLNGGQLSLQNSSCSVTATLGRIAEFSGTKYSLLGNTLISNPLKTALTQSDRTSGVQAIWADKNSILLKNEKNTETGFSVSKK